MGAIERIRKLARPLLVKGPPPEYGYVETGNLTVPADAWAALLDVAEAAERDLSGKGGVTLRAALNALEAT